jgi:uncharacterized protein
MRRTLRPAAYFSEMTSAFCQTSLLVVQPTPFCNINCTYCYLPHRTSTKRLSLETAEPLFQKLLRFPTVWDSVTVVWHAGEPLVLPPDYYEAMFQLIERVAPPSLKVRHSFQTNGTLITPAWCDFIKKWNINVGISIDGPAEFHDNYRKMRNGTGSFERTYKGMKALQDASISFHVISVLTLESLLQPEKMFEFYAVNGIDYVCFNIEEQEGAHSRSRFVNETAGDASYRAFLQKFLELSFRSGQFVPVREIEHALRAIGAHGQQISNEEAEPFRILSVDCEANISTFSPELLGLEHHAYGKFEFGNLLTDDFEKISHRITSSKLYADVAAGVSKCRAECAYFGLCGGGAAANKIFENGSAASTETASCRKLMRSVDVVLDLIEKLPASAVAEELAKRNRAEPPAAPLHQL